MDDFLAMHGHELRNPLSADHECNAIDSPRRVQNPETCRLGSSRSSTGKREICDGIALCDRLGSTLRASTRGPNRASQAQPVDVSQVIEQAVEVVRPPAPRSRTMALQVVLRAAGPLRVDADVTRLEQSSSS
jgi:C4-dicarboxylate-specific signal transduction histidine kinase